MNTKPTPKQKEILKKFIKDLKKFDLISTKHEFNKFLVTKHEKHLILFTEGEKRTKKLDPVFKKPERVRRTRVISIGPRGAVRSLIGRRCNTYKDILQKGFQERRYRWRARRRDRRKETTCNCEKSVKQYTGQIRLV